MILNIPENIVIDTYDSYNKIIYQSNDLILFPFINNMVFKSYNKDFRERDYINFSVLIFKNVYSIELNCREKPLNTIIINENNFKSSINEEYIIALENCELKILFEKQFIYFDKIKREFNKRLFDINGNQYIETLPIDLINELNLTEIKILAQL